MATSVDQKNFVKTALRLPPELHMAVHASAQKKGRSYNAELVALIERGLTVPAAFIPAPPTLGTIDDEGRYTERSPKELFAELTSYLEHAAQLARIFKEYENGDLELADVSDEPAWIASREESPLQTSRDSSSEEGPVTPKTRPKK
ncbi:Arc family DNA-binding protein [Pseudorhodoferax sp. LjRoot39]|uniref:Arc family DNA-binding protein n=1 Tax=Pseudorhodoferax sp. LjRoot39 TaxID=3342328 RepID=UPI003ECCE7BD